MLEDRLDVIHPGRVGRSLIVCPDQRRDHTAGVPDDAGRGGSRVESVRDPVKLAINIRAWVSGIAGLDRELGRAIGVGEDELGKDDRRSRLTHDRRAWDRPLGRLCGHVRCVVAEIDGHWILGRLAEDPDEELRLRAVAGAEPEDVIVGPQPRPVGRLGKNRLRFFPLGPRDEDPDRSGCDQAPRVVVELE